MSKSVKSDKKILIISGTHGNEMSAVQLGLRLVKYYKESNIKVIPFLNEPGLLKNEREVTQSHSADLNRSFGEYEETHRNIVLDVQSLVEEYDYIIDIHNSPRCANFCLIDIGKNDDLISNICERADVEYAHRYSKGATIKDYANQFGKIGITYEFSGMQTLNNEKELELAFNDITSLVRTINALDEGGRRPKGNIQELESFYCLETGFIHFCKDINDIVTPGETVFEVISEDGRVIEAVRNMTGEYIKLIAMAPSFQARGSSVVQYIIKE